MSVESQSLPFFNQIVEKLSSQIIASNEMFLHCLVGLLFVFVSLSGITLMMALFSNAMIESRSRYDMTFFEFLSMISFMSGVIFGVVLLIGVMKGYRISQASIHRQAIEEARNSPLFEKIEDCKIGCSFSISPLSDITQDPDFRALHPHIVQGDEILSDLNSWFNGHKMMKLISITVDNDKNILGYFQLYDGTNKTDTILEMSMDNVGELQKANRIVDEVVTAHESHKNFLNSSRLQ